MPFYRVGSDGSLGRLHLGIVQADGTILPTLAAPVPQRGRVHELGVVASLEPPAPQRGRVHEVGVVGEPYVAPVIPLRGRVHEVGVVGVVWVPPEPDRQRGSIYEVALTAYRAPGIRVDVDGVPFFTLGGPVALDADGAPFVETFGGPIALDTDGVPYITIGA